MLVRSIFDHHTLSPWRCCNPLLNVIANFTPQPSGNPADLFFTLTFPPRFFWEVGGGGGNRDEIYNEEGGEGGEGGGNGKCCAMEIY